MTGEDEDRKHIERLKAKQRELEARGSLTVDEREELDRIDHAIAWRYSKRRAKEEEAAWQKKSLTDDDLKKK